ANSRQWKLVYPRRIGKSAVNKVTRRRILLHAGRCGPGAALFIPRVVARRNGSGSSMSTAVAPPKHRSTGTRLARCDAPTFRARHRSWCDACRVTDQQAADTVLTLACQGTEND